MTKDEWDRLVDGRLPAPELADILMAIDKADGEVSTYHSMHVLKRLREMLVAHRDAAALGMFNDD